MPKGLRGFQKGNKIALGKHWKIKDTSNFHKPKTENHKKKISFQKIQWYSKDGNIAGFQKGNNNPMYEKEGDKHPNWKGGKLDYMKKHPLRPKPDRCEICGIMEENLNRKLYFDHDHKTGKFRGWICHQCNTALGMARDNIEILEAMIKYLENS
jgi:hypothetical protein